MRERFNSLLQQCLVKELVPELIYQSHNYMYFSFFLQDRVRYCIAVHNRASNGLAEPTLGESWERETCDALIAVSQDVCAMGMLHVLADG